MKSTNYFDIPKKGFVELDAEELIRLGYRIPGKVYFVYDNPYFRISSKPDGEFILGSSNITKLKRMRIPKSFAEKNKRCRIMYDSETIHIDFA